MKTLQLFICAMFLADCAPPKVYSSYTDWDLNNDYLLERSEFVNAYVRTTFFEKWGDGISPVTYPEFFEGTFKALDSNKDHRLNPYEFNTKIKNFYFGMFNDNFNRWDDNSDAYIEKVEFNRHVSQTNMAAMWDTSADKEISQKELAAGMFYMCDANDNTKIDQIEFKAWNIN